ncbi:hypothetical protein UFOVP314_57 [uncultured Caudovirales phage]|uniref:Uncharacterized protein n=1 Tax=uncultured Caudovirales phage TaxID=2100421 RepID=A0A6J5LQU6_9CAUD|nr:hypothetical protein UFOVP314_57 [uncultured Caudovirales phage]
MDKPVEAHNPVAAFLVAFVGTLVVGVIVSNFVGATTIEDISSMTDQPGDGWSRSFNWLLMSIFGAAALVAGTVAWAGSQVALYLWRAEQRELQAAARTS